MHSPAPVADIDVGSLERRVRDLEHRVSELEASRIGAPGVSTGPVRAHESREPVHVRHTVLLDVMSLVGRSLVVLGVAYLLRALTDARTLAPMAGIALGLVYAAIWLRAADRAAAAGATVSAIFHAVTAALIFFPLLWESTTRFHVLTPAWSASLLAAASAMTLLVALRTRAQTIAWIVVLGALPASVALIAATGALLPFAVFLIALGLATLWLGYEREWIALRWPAAAMADLACIGLAVRAVAPHPLDPPIAAIAVQLLLLGGYLSVIGARTVIRARDVIPFEIAQTCGALVAGFGAAAYVATVTGADAGLLGVATVVFGAASYALAFVFVDRRQRTNFYFYTSLALIYVVSGTALVLGGSRAAVVWSALAVAAAYLAARTTRATLGWHAVVYGCAAAIGSGLLAHASWAWASRSAGTWPAIDVGGLTALASLIAASLMPLPRERRGGGSSVSAARVVLLAAIAWTAGGTLVAGAADVMTIRPALLPTLRTIVLALMALALASGGRIRRLREASWLTYPTLIAGGLEVIVEDFPRSTPATLFAALAVYGAALVVAPRLLRRSADADEAGADGLPETRHPVCEEPAPGLPSR